MPQFPEPKSPCLLRFNGQLIDAALALVAEHDVAGRPAYAGLVGKHMRHVIEHYESLLSTTPPRIVDYDQRPRDPDLERSESLARMRLLALRERLIDWRDFDLDATVSIHGQIGLGGEMDFVVESTLGRELACIASHTVHHFALLQAHCLQHGIPTGEHFGKAPATVAHERSRDQANAVASNTLHRKELTCPTLLRAA
jgi:hypothetical protein